MELSIFSSSRSNAAFRRVGENGIVRFRKFVGDRTRQFNQPFAVAREFVALSISSSSPALRFAVVISLI